MLDGLVKRVVNCDHIHNWDYLRNCRSKGVIQCSPRVALGYNTQCWSAAEARRMRWSSTVAPPVLQLSAGGGREDSSAVDHAGGRHGHYPPLAGGCLERQACMPHLHEEWRRVAVQHLAIPPTQSPLSHPVSHWLDARASDTRVATMCSQTYVHLCPSRPLT